MIELATFSELKRPRPWRAHATGAGYHIVDAEGVTVALNLSLADAQLIITASDCDPLPQGACCEKGSVHG